jgi:holo-[acyl-carrier-protein] synthase
MASVLGIGVDLVEIGRFQRMLRRYECSFGRLLFTAHEISICEGDSLKQASVFAVKESVAKALGVGLGYIFPNGIHTLDVQVDIVEGRRIQIALCGSAQIIADRVGVDQWCVTSAVRGSYAMALAVASGNRRLDVNVLRHQR